MSPAATARAGRARGRPPPSASGGARLAPWQRLADQRQSVVAEIHVGPVDEDGRRTKAAAGHHCIGVDLELSLDLRLADTCEELLRIDTEALADVRQHRVLRNVLVAAPIGLE